MATLDETLVALQAAVDAVRAAVEAELTTEGWAAPAVEAAEEVAETPAA